MKKEDYKITIISLIIMLIITIFGWIDSQKYASKFGKELIEARTEMLQCQMELKSVYQLLLIKK